jgi:ribose transport system permease protein
VIRRVFSTYGTLAGLLILCLYFTWATYHAEIPTGRYGAQLLASELAAAAKSGKRIVVVSQPDSGEAEFADALAAELRSSGAPHAAVIKGDPPSVRESLEQLGGGRVDIVATTPACGAWAVWDGLRKTPSFSALQVRTPEAHGQSTFLSASNLRNVADQIAVIAIIAIGMTMVIITGGIDLSVGSLVALSAVSTAWFIQRWGGASASVGAMVGAGIAATLICGVIGLFSGATVTLFRIPPFIATLAMMQVASGLAFIVARGESIYDLPPSFTWLGRGEALGGIPNSVILMLAAYVAAHLLMTRTVTGRRIYAVGGNAEASRLSGVSNPRTLLFVYLVSGLASGIGGVITASQLKAGAPTYGLMYELYVIAAVVVGGTSLTGGEGRIFGTLVGAFIIAVIRNGMNLMNVEPYTQKIVLGLVILAAVLLDMIRRRRAR